QAFPNSRYVENQGISSVAAERPVGATQDDLEYREEAYPDDIPTAYVDYDGASVEEPDSDYVQSWRYNNWQGKEDGKPPVRTGDVVYPDGSPRMTEDGRALATYDEDGNLVVTDAGYDEIRRKNRELPMDEDGNAYQRVDPTGEGVPVPLYDASGGLSSDSTKPKGDGPAEGSSEGDLSVAVEFAEARTYQADFAERGGAVPVPDSVRALGRREAPLSDDVASDEDFDFGSSRVASFVGSGAGDATRVVGDMTSSTVVAGASSGEPVKTSDLNQTEVFQARIADALQNNDAQVSVGTILGQNLQPVERGVATGQMTPADVFRRDGVDARDDVVPDMGGGTTGYRVKPAPFSYDQVAEMDPSSLTQADPARMPVGVIRGTGGAESDMTAQLTAAGIGTVRDLARARPEAIQQAVSGPDGMPLSGEATAMLQDRARGFTAEYQQVQAMQAAVAGDEVRRVAGARVLQGAVEQVMQADVGDAALVVERANQALSQGGVSRFAGDPQIEYQVASYSSEAREAGVSTAVAGRAIRELSVGGAISDNTMSDIRREVAESNPSASAQSVNNVVGHIQERAVAVASTAGVMPADAVTTGGVVVGSVASGARGAVSTVGSLAGVAVGVGAATSTAGVVAGGVGPVVGAAASVGAVTSVVNPLAGTAAAVGAVSSVSASQAVVGKQSVLPMPSGSVGGSRTATPDEPP
ncbi:MAG: hypothetical protein AAF125_15855, partial [Chloroflexota bacterium]